MGNRLLRTRAQTPGICISNGVASHVVPISKKNISPHPYSYKKIVEYVMTNFSCKEIAVNPTTIRIFKENMSRNINRTLSKFCPRFFEFPNTSANRLLYKNFEGHSPITLYLEQESCYFETDSIFLYEQLILIKGVDQYDYDNETIALKELISILSKPQT